MHSFWIIVSGATPTSFRARRAEDLLPTLRQLQRTQPDTALAMVRTRAALGVAGSAPRNAQQARRHAILRSASATGGPAAITKIRARNSRSRATRSARDSRSDSSGDWADRDARNGPRPKASWTKPKGTWSKTDKADRWRQPQGGVAGNTSTARTRDSKPDGRRRSGVRPSRARWRKAQSDRATRRATSQRPGPVRQSRATAEEPVARTAVVASGPSARRPAAAPMAEAGGIRSRIAAGPATKARRPIHRSLQRPASGTAPHGQRRAASTASPEGPKRLVISHIVLFNPKTDVSADDRRSFALQLGDAVARLPVVRAAQVGRCD